MLIATTIANWAYKKATPFQEKGHANTQDLTDTMRLSRCALNPTTMQSKKYHLTPAKKQKRIAVRGGKAGSLERAGLNALHFYNPRFYDGSATIGFRSAYIDLG